MTTEIIRLQQIAKQIRRDIVRMVHQVNSGHPGGSLGCADLLVVLFFHSMRYKPSPFNPSGVHEDMFFLSNGHISPVYYASLARAGFFPIEELATFRKLNTRLQGHPTNHDGLPGVRIASGSLGQGISVACGAALSKKLNNDDTFVFVLTGDGELQEGQVWEALMFAAHKKLDNLVAFVDVNNQQIDGTVDDVMSLMSLEDKFAAFGWEVLSLDGHNINEIISTIALAKQKAQSLQRPVVVLMKTTMGRGVDFMENDHKWHGTAPNDAQLATALAQLTIDDKQNFALQDY